MLMFRLEVYSKQNKFQYLFARTQNIYIKHFATNWVDDSKNDLLPEEIRPLST